MNQTNIQDFSETVAETAHVANHPDWNEAIQIVIDDWEAGGRFPFRVKNVPDSVVLAYLLDNLSFSESDGLLMMETTRFGTDPSFFIDGKWQEGDEEETE